VSLGAKVAAMAELRDMKMQPSLERALRHKQIMKA
jgi:hypothetical protein